MCAKPTGYVAQFKLLLNLINIDDAPTAIIIIYAAIIN